ncbi:MAG: NAD-dependent DNA ligase LigA [Candidatus Colwellbacteria bacterium]
MDKTEAKKRIAKLRQEINRYRHAYHVEDKSLISDAALDSLKRELAQLEDEYPDLVTPDSPTQRVGGEPAKQFKRVRHESQMLSFNDIFSEGELRAWWDRMQNHLKSDLKANLYVEPKIDGFAIELTYEQGILILAATRGDGLVGEDVTANVKTVDAIPLNIKDLAKIDVPSELIVRGEIFMTKKEFERINKEQEQKEGKAYANPRNTAAGSIRQLDPRVAASRKLDAIVYGLVTDLGQQTHAQEHELLHLLGFKTDNKHHKQALSLEEVVKYRQKWERERDVLPYQIDGIVVVVDGKNVFDKLGIVGKAPRGAIAYKFTPEEATTTLQDIKIQVGRTGALTPVAILDPVEVGGVTIMHATLHNFDQIKRLGLKIGDTVIISRAGDVIPQVTEVLVGLRTGNEKEFKAPEKCPIDGSEIIKEGVIWRCGNANCGARLRERIDHFVSRKAFDIRGMGPKIASRFIDEGFILDFSDIFKLDKKEVAALDGFGETSAEKLLEEIEKSKDIDISRFIYALGILHVGEETAYMLSRELKFEGDSGRPSDLIGALGGLSGDELMALPDIGPKVAKSIESWFQDERHIKLLKDLDAVGIRLKFPKKTKGQGKFEGKTIVITGSLESMSREQAQVRIREEGGSPSNSISSQTDYLVAGGDPGSKLEKANKLGVKVLTEKDFLDMLS